MTRLALARPGLRRASPRRALRRLRFAVSALLLAVSLSAFVAGVGLLGLRRELRSRLDNDTRPCPACRSPALLDGRSLTDEQGYRLLFATPEDAAHYASFYGAARDAGR